jgi:hypothetical protein
MLAKTEEELEHLACAWIAFQHAWDLNQTSPETEALWWAYNAVGELVVSNPEDSWKLILMIHGLDQSEAINQILSAQTFEDFMEVHGPTYIARVETEVEKDLLFGRIVDGIWQARIRDDVWGRLTALQKRYREACAKRLRAKRRLIQSVSRRRNRRTL